MSLRFGATFTTSQKCGVVFISDAPTQHKTIPKDFLSKLVANSEKVCIFATAYEQRIELWCNGNTADFGSVVLGSSPGSSTHLEVTSVTSFFVAVCLQTNSTIESLLSVQAPQNLSQSLMLHIRHKKNEPSALLTGYWVARIFEFIARYAAL